MKLFVDRLAKPQLWLAFITLLIVNSCSNEHLISIAVTPASPSVTQSGDTLQFQATGTTNHSAVAPENLTSGVTWTSSAASVATITSSGLATAAGCGTTTISATDGSVSGQTILTNTCAGSGGTQPVLESINLYPSSPTIPQIGQTTQFVALALYSPIGSNNDLTSVVTWASSNAGVAAISSGGLATAVSCGTTTITALYLGVLGQTSLIVPCSGNETLQSVEVLPNNPTIPQIGQSTQFVALGTLFTGGQEDLTSSVAWSSSNTDIATVGAGTGTVAAVNCGTSLISAEFQPTTGPPLVGTSLLTITCNSIISIELIVTKAGTTAGTVTSLPTGIDCGTVCGGLFNEGTGFTLFAAPAATWSGCDQVILGACSFTLVPDAGTPTQKQVTVTF